MQAEIKQTQELTMMSCPCVFDIAYKGDAGGTYADQILSIFLRISSIFWSSSEITEAHLCNSSLMTAACF